MPKFSLMQQAMDALGSKLAHRSWKGENHANNSANRWPKKLPTKNDSVRHCCFKRKSTIARCRLLHRAGSENSLRKICIFGPMPRATDSAISVWNMGIGGSNGAGI